VTAINLCMANILISAIKMLAEQETVSSTTNPTFQLANSILPELMDASISHSAIEVKAASLQVLFAISYHVILTTRYYANDLLRVILLSLQNSELQIYGLKLLGTLYTGNEELFNKNTTKEYYQCKRALESVVNTSTDKNARELAEKILLSFISINNK